MRTVTLYQGAFINFNSRTPKSMKKDANFKRHLSMNSSYFLLGLLAIRFNAWSKTLGPLHDP